MHLPAANECLAEAVLLNECACLADFRNPSTVYSYDLASGDETEGVFLHYFRGLRRRHEDMATACKAAPTGIVRYGDIRTFYPSIGIDIALDTWRHQAEKAGLSNGFQELGAKLIADHSTALAPRQGGILTGPMFSHLLGNLVLRPVDQQMGKLRNVRYFRYVDDIVLVGAADAVAAGYKALEARLSDLGLELHDEKSSKHLVIRTREWLRGEHDFKDSRRSTNWTSLVGGLRRYILANPQQVPAVQAVLRDNGLRLPVLDYAHAVRERSYLSRFRELSVFRWFRSRVRRRGVDAVLEQAKSLREVYHREAQELLDKMGALEGYERKRAIPKLRYRAGRLAFLAGHHALAALAEQLREVPELLFQAAVLGAVATGDVDDLLNLGANAVQAAAQVLRAAGKPAIIRNAIDTEVRIQGVAVLGFNGVKIEGGGGGSWREHELVRFAFHGAAPDLMRSSDPFVRELACLHGLSDQPRHPEMLETAFDESQELALDALNELRGSGSP